MMKPSVSLLCKLGSIAVHVDELLSADGHEFDRMELYALLRDPEVSAWMKEMDAAAMLPKKRNLANWSDEMRGDDDITCRNTKSTDAHKAAHELDDQVDTLHAALQRVLDVSRAALLQPCQDEASEIPAFLRKQGN